MQLYSKYCLLNAALISNHSAWICKLLENIPSYSVEQFYSILESEKKEKEKIMASVITTTFQLFLRLNLRKKKATPINKLNKKTDTENIPVLQSTWLYRWEIEWKICRVNPFGKHYNFMSILKLGCQKCHRISLVGLIFFRISISKTYSPQKLGRWTSARSYNCRSLITRSIIMAWIVLVSYGVEYTKTPNSWNIWRMQWLLEGWKLKISMKADMLLCFFYRYLNIWLCSKGNNSIIYSSIIFFFC